MRRDDRPKRFAPPTVADVVPIPGGVVRLLTPAQHFPLGVRGTVQVARVFRERRRFPNPESLLLRECLELVDPNEYDVAPDASGMLWLTFKVPQLDFYNDPHSIWAEVYPIAASERDEGFLRTSP